MADATEASPAPVLATNSILFRLEQLSRDPTRVEAIRILLRGTAKPEEVLSFFLNEQIIDSELKTRLESFWVGNGPEYGNIHTEVISALRAAFEAVDLGREKYLKCWLLLGAHPGFRLRAVDTDEVVFLLALMRHFPRGWVQAKMPIDQHFQDGLRAEYATLQEMLRP